MEDMLLVSKIRKVHAAVFVVCLVIFGFGPACFAETFTHLQNNELLYCYAAGQTQNDKSAVLMQQSGLVKPDATRGETDRLKKNKVVVITLDGPIMYEIETAMFERTMSRISDEEPLFVLLEIDTPGGRTDLTQRICGAITRVKNCPVIAFVKGGKYSGAISAGAAVTFACDKIYIANNTIIGAATTIAFSQAGQPQSLEKSFGEDVAEKFNSAWRAYLASLAERNRRSGLVARAMVDKDIEVIEVSEDGKRLFIEPVNKKPNQELIHTWSTKNSLLTLTAQEAVKCRIADKLANSREEVLNDLGSADAKVVVNNNVQKARAELEKAMEQLDKIKKSIDFKVKQSEHPLPTPEALQILRTAKSEFGTLIKLARKYPDLPLDIKVLEEELNTIKANYKRIKKESVKKK